MSEINYNITVVFIRRSFLASKCMITTDMLESMGHIELLSLHADILAQLRSKNILRTSNNPTGDYAEWLISQIFGMELCNNSAAGIDAIDSDGNRVQIKARRVISGSHARNLSALRNYNNAEFDYLIAVIFDEKYNVIEAYKISHEVIGKYAKYSKHVNAHIITLKGEILSECCVVDIRKTIIEDAVLLNTE